MMMVEGMQQQDIHHKVERQWKATDPGHMQ
jgi:hypothetical protein